MSRHKKLCHDRKNCVSTKKCWKNQKKVENGYFGLFSSSFHPRTINTRFFRFLGQREGGRTPLMGFSLYIANFSYFCCRF